jgi:hypothetical protein
MEEPDERRAAGAKHYSPVDLVTDAPLIAFAAMLTRRLLALGRSGAVAWRGAFLTPLAMGGSAGNHAATARRASAACTASATMLT